MKTSRKDLFDLNLCIRGLGYQLTSMHSELYEYCYYLTFKRSMKTYKDEFADPWENPIRELEFFLESTDPFVTQGANAVMKLVYCKVDLRIRWGIDEQSDLNNEVIEAESYRYRPYYLYWKESKSYRKMNLFVVRTLTSIIEFLYLYACAITVQSYKIPLVFKRQFKLQEEKSLLLLNVDDNTVSLLITLIIGLRQDRAAYQLLIENNGKSVQNSQSKKAVVANR